MYTGEALGLTPALALALYANDVAIVDEAYGTVPYGTETVPVLTGEVPRGLAGTRPTVGEAPGTVVVTKLTCGTVTV